ncbi:MAG: tetratricopeptide repeat protein [candidate division KSB1 bacterium]|nr:tetratricopeptide repeat protein [candidate division KSB1 bacterium]MDZ7341866.1 tetratricopeptide repeat protein [candidate division KSB1 bacterium]
MPIKKSFLDLRDVRELIRLKKFDEAEKILNELIAEHPDDQYVQGAFFDVYLKKGSYEKAHKIIDALLKKDPDNYFFLSRKGDLLVAMNKNKDALKIFTNLYNANKDPHVGWRLANEHYRLKQYDQAEYYFDQTIPKLFDKPELNFLGFLIKKALKKYDKAMDLIDAAINHSSQPDQYKSQKLKFQTELKGISAQQWEKSIKYSTTKDEPLLLKELAEKFLNEGKYDKAEQYFKEILKHDPDQFYKSRLGYVYYKWGKYDLALSIFLEMPLKYFLIPSFINMVIKSAREMGQEQHVVEHLQDLLEKHPEARSLWGAIKRLAKK